MVKRHTRPNPQRQIKGGIAERESQIAISNVMIVTSGGVATRIGYRLEGSGPTTRRVRIARKGGGRAKGKTNINIIVAPQGQGGPPPGPPPGAPPGGSGSGARIGPVRLALLLPPGINFPARLIVRALQLSRGR